MSFPSSGSYIRQLDNDDTVQEQPSTSPPPPPPLPPPHPEPTQTQNASAWKNIFPSKLFGGHRRSQTATNPKTVMTPSAMESPRTHKHRRAPSLAPGTPGRPSTQIEMSQVQVATKLAENQLSPNLATNLLSFMSSGDGGAVGKNGSMEDSVVIDMSAANAECSNRKIEVSVSKSFDDSLIRTALSDDTSSNIHMPRTRTGSDSVTGDDASSTQPNIYCHMGSNFNSRSPTRKSNRFQIKHHLRRLAITSMRRKRSRTIRGMTSSSKHDSSQLEEKLGTYSGVFLPCLAQIVGVIFFLRLPTITGQAGTIGTTLIILICVFSTFVTSLSLSAIASNGTIQAGGPYYIISRTLGVEIGGALGLLFYLGTTLGASMHVMGAVETLFHRKKHAYAYEINSFGFSWNSVMDSCPSQVWSLLLMLLIANIVSVGSKYVTGAANFFLAAVGLSILSIVVGTILFASGFYDGSLSDDERVFNDNLYPNYRPDSKTGVTPTFWSLVSIFYPATTGILAGTNRSSKLATPNKSIPIGTISAIAVTTSLYIMQVWLIGSVVDHETLIFNKLVLTNVAFPSRVMAKVGMVTSCIGAALQCMAGAPQLLSAIAADGAIPFLTFLTRKKKSRRRRKSLSLSDSAGLQNLGITASFEVSGNNSVSTEKSQDVDVQNSKRAVWFSWAIASLGTLMGNIDRITPILTMFYLMMYGGINLCCFLLAWVDSPGFRPQFKYFSRNIALLGFIWCLALALLISWPMALLAILLMYLIFKYIAISAQRMAVIGGETNSSRSGTNWGDVFDSVRYKITTAILAGVTGTENFHAKNWRPQLLTVVDTNDVGTPLSNEGLALASQFKGGRGLNMVVSIKHGSFLNPMTFELSQQCNARLKACMEKERLRGFSEVIFTESSFSEAVWSAVMHSGLGPVSPNTVLLSWMADWRRRMNIGQDRQQENIDLSDDGTVSPCSVDEYVATLKGLGLMHRAVCLFKGNKFPRIGDIAPVGSTIDIYWIVDDGGLCLLLSYIISRNPIWRRNVHLQVFAVTTSTKDNPRNIEASVVDFLQQIRINASVHVVNIQGIELADDFRARSNDGCPSSVPIVTIGETLRMDKDDHSCSSESSHDNLFSNFSREKACLPSVAAYELGSSSDERCNTEVPDRREYVAMTENDAPHLFLRVETAKKLNNMIRLNSPSASLVVTHLPLSYKVSNVASYMEYIDAMLKDVDNMLLIQGTGVEYLTTVA